MNACACGTRIDTRSLQCRACWRLSGASLGNNSFRVRPDLLIAAQAVRRICPDCERPIKPGNYARHVARHDPWSSIDAEGDCWEWRGATSNGYGYVKQPFDTTGGKVAHRWVWESLVGPIPKGLVLDHLCRNTLCVNPDHLEPVTIPENTLRRGFSPTARKVRGHIARAAA